jgi:hypothetical protein
MQRYFPTARSDRNQDRAAPKPIPISNGIVNVKRSYERYVTLARAAASTGDLVEVENLYQHAEHYFRLMRKQAA